MVGSSGNINIPAIERFAELYSVFRTEHLWYSPNGNMMYYRCPISELQMRSYFFYQKLETLRKIEPRIYRVSIQIAFIIYNQKTERINIFYPSYNTVITNDSIMMYIHPHNEDKSMKQIRLELEKAEAQSFMNDFTMQCAENSSDSLAVPFYCLYHMLLLPE